MKFMFSLRFFLVARFQKGKSIDAALVLLAHGFYHSEGWRVQCLKWSAQFPKVVDTNMLIGHQH